MRTTSQGSHIVEELGDDDPFVDPAHLGDDLIRCRGQPV